MGFSRFRNRKKKLENTRSLFLEKSGSMSHHYKLSHLETETKAKQLGKIKISALILEGNPFFQGVKKTECPYVSTSQRSSTFTNFRIWDDRALMQW